MSYRNHPFSREILVDTEGNGDYTTITAAIAAATALSPSSSDFVMITLNEGTYTVPIGTAVPAWVSMRVRGGGRGGLNAPTAVIVPDVPFVAGDTSWITLGANTSYTSVSFVIPAGFLPANFSADFDMITPLGGFSAEQCLFAVVSPYVGTNTLTLMKYVSGASAIDINVQDSQFFGNGSSIVSVDIADIDATFNDVIFLGAPGTVVKGSGAGQVLDFNFCNLASLSSSGLIPAVYVDMTAPAEISLRGTRVPFSKRVGARILFLEEHATPRQIGAASAADVQPVAGTDTIVVNTGLIPVTTGASSFDITLPLRANVPNGTKYTFIKVDAGAGVATVKGNGVETINGGTGGVALSNQFESVVIANEEGAADWLVVGGSVAALSSTLGTKSGEETAGSFAGSPLTKTVTFGTAFADALYSVSIIGSDVRSWSVDSQAAGSFVINSNSAVALASPVSWIAIKHGET